MSDPSDVDPDPASIRLTADGIARIFQRIRDIDAIEHTSEEDRTEVVELRRILDDFRNMLLELRPGLQ